MAAKRDLASLLVATIESVEGVAQAATNSTDVVTTENLQIKFNEGNEATNENTGGLDGTTDLPIGGAAEVTFDTYAKGSGTGGTAPEIGKLFKACGWGETINASAIGVPTAASAGTANTATVPASPFAGGVDAYKGMFAKLTGNPSAGIYSGITAFSGSQVLTFAESFSPVLSASTLVQIPAQTIYSPISSGIVSLTLRVYKDGVQHTLVGCRGSFKIAWTTAKSIKFSWTFKGILQMPRADVSNPANLSPDYAQAKLIFANDSNLGGLCFDGSRIDCNTFSFDCGNTLDNPMNPNQPSGFDITEITGRNIQFSFDPKLASIATRDVLAAKRASTLKVVELFSRRGAGNSLGIVIPQGQMNKYEYAKKGGYIGEAIGARGTGPNAGAYIAFGF